MTPAGLIAAMTAAGVRFQLFGDSLEVDAPAGVLTDDDIADLRTHKADVMRLLDDDIEAIDPDDVPICDRCGCWCDVMTLAGSWHCSACDPFASARRNRTMAMLERVFRLRSDPES